MKVRVISIIAVAIAIISIFWLKGRKNNDMAIPETVSYNYDIRPILSDKCYSCHGPDKTERQAGLRFDIQDSALAPLKETKGAFAIIPGKPGESELIRRVISDDPEYMMPTPESHLGKLTEREIALLKKWVEQGAKFEKHWAFIPPVKAPLPQVSNDEWPVNEIDHFTLAAMEQHGLEPNEEADKEHLLKRVSLDITGLLPAIEQTDSFLADKSEKAYENIVDNLLKQPQYGEKMALYWLDVSRYSDSYGYQDDNVRTQWPYRDWLIHAFNQNLPYDQFITWQLAGDMLPNATKEQILATAFLRNHKYTEEGGVIPEEYRVEYVVDKVKTYGTGIMALTTECAQCHDHRYDPISQKDYFGIYAFFNTSKEEGFEGDVSVSKPAKTPILNISQSERKELLNFINSKDTGTLTVSVMEEGDTVRTTHLLSRGLYDQPAEVVQAKPLPAVMDFDTAKYERNRLGLARWTVNKNNPLTARVFVNQVWQEIFGKGIVQSSGDFGMQGNLPTHPQLLDWLAADFMEHNWDIKYLVKKILMSATYRQSAKVTEKHLKTDPQNEFLARAPRIRLKAELVKDMVLFSSGLLQKEIGGPSVKPYQPKGLWETATSGRGELASYRQDKGDKLYRRGMYTFIKLTVPPPGMMIFDASNRDRCEVKRVNTSTPLQALVMLNDPTVLEGARVMAERLEKEKISDEEKITKAFRKILARKPNEKEKTVLVSYFLDQQKQFESGTLQAAQLLAAGEFPNEKNISENKAAALMKTISAIYNAEEAITKN